MASLKSLFSERLSQLALLLLLVIMALGTEKEMAKAHSTCSNQLSNLNVCAPFVVPGASITNPSAGCCDALQAVDHDCLCNTLRIASQLPSQCDQPPFACGN
ncbi:Bifunctional inhibitor/plant lipid transfer protein/seed storage helical domain [Sesbania bispinosa]|nr:Bifunctional inhibitor/plant lipid transfer protein/seed storage helical domain [Sesbania bispinosa]